MILGAWLRQIGKSANPLDATSWKDAPADLAKNFRPGGVFTTMRLDNCGGNVTPICLSIHIDRLIKNEMGISRDVIENELLQFINDYLFQKFGEYRWLGLTVMLAPSTYLNTNEDQVPSFGYCLKVIEEPPKSCTVLACLTKARSDPTTKSTSWIEERKALKDLINGSDHNEVLIVDETSREVLEGLSSNFGVLTKEGRMVTAPDTMVLPGSVMKLVKQACVELDVPVDERCLSIDDADQWQAAFITSTSRLILPITEIHQMEDSPLKIDSLSSSLLCRIQYRLNQCISNRDTA